MQYVCICTYQRTLSGSEFPISSSVQFQVYLACSCYVSCICFASSGKKVPTVVVKHFTYTEKPTKYSKVEYRRTERRRRRAQEGEEERRQHNNNITIIIMMKKKKSY